MMVGQHALPPAQPFDLDRFLTKHLRFTKKRIRYTKDELLSLINRAQFEIQKEGSSILVEIKCLPINIVGDLHGQWRDLLRIFNTLGVPGSARYLFLGDYIDRGDRSVECISLLLALKIRFRTKVFLLRGNHECDYINYNYGFFEELKRRFSLGEALELFKAFNSLFNYFPLAGLVVDRVLCMHGGISPELKSLDQLRKIRLPKRVMPSDGITLDLLWSDPKPSTDGFIRNDVRDCSYAFGADAVMKLCNRLNIDMIVRAHQALGNGFGFFARQHMITIFSAPRYLRPDMNSFGAVLRINRQYEFSVMLLNPITEETRGQFVEQFNLASKIGTLSMDEVTIIEKMPKDRIDTTQISEKSEMEKLTQKDELKLLKMEKRQAKKKQQQQQKGKSTEVTTKPGAKNDEQKQQQQKSQRKKEQQQQGKAPAPQTKPQSKRKEAPKKTPQHGKAK